MFSCCYSYTINTHSDTCINALLERTFIQWIGAAMAIVLVAQLIFSTAHNEASTEALRAGNWMMGTALCVAIYGMIVYYRRMYLMTSSKPYGYADGVGPAVFTVFTIVGM